MWIRGTLGGGVVFTGTPKELAEYGQTITADYLRKSLRKFSIMKVQPVGMTACQMKITMGYKKSGNSKKSRDKKRGLL